MHAKIHIHREFRMRGFRKYRPMFFWHACMHACMKHPIQNKTSPKETSRRAGGGGVYFYLLIFTLGRERKKKKKNLS